ncbi:MAG: ribosome-associated translation inhibitor RaiA [Rickettsiaceae bacterium]
MNISISGKHVELNEQLKQYVEKRSNEVMRKYFSQPVNTKIHFYKDSYQFVCDIVTHVFLKGSKMINSKTHSNDIYHAFDTCIARLERQLRKYKSRIIDHHQKDSAKLSDMIHSKAVKYTINPNNIAQQEDESYKNKNFHYESNVTEEDPMEILSLSLDDALMKMDFENLPALMFQNANTNRMNLIYYNHDGNISWIDSK